MDLTCFPFDDFVDLSSLSPSISCKETRCDVLESQTQTLVEPDSRNIEFDAPNHQVPAFPSFETTLLFDHQYFNPEPSDLVWTRFCQGLHTQSPMTKAGRVSSIGSNDGSKLHPTSHSMGPQLHGLPEIDCWSAELSDLISPSEMSRSATDASPRKRSRSSRSSSPGPDQPDKRVMSTVAHRCQWDTCSAIFAQAADLRTHARTHASIQTKCMWSGCFKAPGSTPDLKRHLDTHTKPHICSVCQHQAATARDLSRHTLCHGFATGSAVYYCPSPSCPYREGGHKLPFGRRDNATRHINTKHPNSSSGPIPGIYRL
ncbi:hypothetical protein V8E51_014997 [Hyaloscypha variabilis]